MAPECGDTILPSCANGLNLRHCKTQAPANEDGSISSQPLDLGGEHTLSFGKDLDQAALLIHCPLDGRMDAGSQLVDVPADEHGHFGQSPSQQGGIRFKLLGPVDPAQPPLRAKVLPCSAFPVDVSASGNLWCRRAGRQREKVALRELRARWWAGRQFLSQQADCSRNVFCPPKPPSRGRNDSDEYEAQNWPGT